MDAKNPATQIATLVSIVYDDVMGVIYGNTDHGHFHFRISSKPTHPLTFGRTTGMNV
jgi:hypothetical protein